MTLTVPKHHNMNSRPKNSKTPISGIDSSLLPEVVRSIPLRLWRRVLRDRPMLQLRLDPGVALLAATRPSLFAELSEAALHELVFKDNDVQLARTLWANKITSAPAIRLMAGADVHCAIGPGSSRDLAFALGFASQPRTIDTVLARRSDWPRADRQRVGGALLDGAVWANRSVVTRRILRAGVSVDVDSLRLSLYHGRRCAALLADALTEKQLIVTDSCGRTILEDAVNRGDAACARVLLRRLRGADTNFTGTLVCGCLRSSDIFRLFPPQMTRKVREFVLARGRGAAACGRLEALGVDPYTECKNELTPLMLAAQARNGALIRTMLSAWPPTSRAHTRALDEAILVSSSWGLHASLAAFEAAGQDLGRRLSAMHRTPLANAASHGNERTVRWLLSRGVSPAVLCAQQWTAAHHAVSADAGWNNNCLSLLLRAAPALVHRKNSSGLTPFELAVKNRNIGAMLLTRQVEMSMKR